MMNASGSYPRGGGGKISYVQPEWKFGDLIVGLGSYGQITRKLVSKGYPRVPKSTLAGWKIRNSIPPFWVPVFIQLGIEARIIGSIEDLRVKPAKKAAKPDHQPERTDGQPSPDESPEQP